MNWHVARPATEYRRMTTGRERGEVVWYSALFADYERPYLIVSTASHLFYPDEYIGLAITTTPHEDAIEIGTDHWAVGTLPETSYIKPWNPTILKDDEVRSTAGALHYHPVDTAVDALGTICGR
jgi:hypothetical protein